MIKEKRQRRIRKTCNRFVSATCVDGSCPVIISELDEREYGSGLDCKDCWFRTEDCKDCIFQGSEYCQEKERR